MDIKASIPSIPGIIKVAIAIVVIMTVVKLAPASWGLARWFQPV